MRCLTVLFSLISALVSGFQGPILAKESNAVINVTSPGGSVQELQCKDITLRLSPAGSSADDEVQRYSLPKRPPHSLAIQLPAGTWQTSLDAPGCWGATKKFVVEREGAVSFTYPIWNLKAVKGTLRLPADSSYPEVVRVNFSTSAQEAVGETPKEEVSCPLASNRAFLCRLPATELNLRVSVKGFAPRYLWAVPLGDESPGHDLGFIALRPGASLSGWLVAEGGPSALQTSALKVVLAPEGIAEPTNPKEAALLAAMEVEGVIQPNGFFQFGSLKAGEYLLTVEGEKIATATVTVQVVEGSESQLRHPILLSPPMTASFIVDPPIDYHDGNWRFELSRVDRYKSYFAKISEGEVPPTGWFEVAPVNPTLHLVKIRDSYGQEVLAKMVDLAEIPMPMTLEVGMVPVEGRTFLGDEPLAAKIWFGGRFGAEKVETASNSDGEYEAILPRDGSWRVEIESDEPAVRRKLREVSVAKWDGGGPVRVDLELPGTRLYGKVQAVDGRPPQDTTLVYVVKGSWSGHVSRRVDRSGEFEFVGLEEGLQQIHAKSPDGQSEVLAVTLNEEDERSVTLTLRKQMRVAGRIVDELGRPVPGASAVVQPADQAFIPALRATADGEGRFEANLPQGTELIHATVASPGRTLGVFRLPVEEGETLLIALPTEGGSVVASLTADQEARRERELVLFRNGIPFAEGEIWGWASIHARGASARGDSTVEIPKLVPGQYEACLVPPEDYVAWMMGYRDRRACGSGELTNFGELNLDLSGR